MKYPRTRLSHHRKERRGEGREKNLCIEERVEVTRVLPFRKKRERAVVLIRGYADIAH